MSIKYVNGVLVNQESKEKAAVYLHTLYWSRDRSG